MSYIKFGNYEPEYDTPITSDVVGDLTADEVTELLRQIEALPKEGE